MRKQADIPTSVRVLLACLIAFAVRSSPAPEATRTVVLLTLLAWTSDALDGQLARQAPGTRTSWVGAHDLEADLSVALAMALSLAVWSGAPTALLMGAVMIASLGWLALHTEAPIQVGMAIVYVLFVHMAWRLEPVLGAAVVAWIAAVVVLTRPRVHTQVVSFLNNFRTTATR